MPTPYSNYSCRIIAFLFFLVNIPAIHAQCNSTANPPTIQCVDAPMNCLINSCYTTTDEVDQGWNGFCGSNTVIHNPQYFEIIPNEDCIEIHIHVDNCEPGSTALQAALVSSCEWQPCPGNNVPCPDVLDCDPGTGVGGTMVIDACELTPGVSLWLVIDGSSNSQCQYTFEFVSGLLSPQIELDSMLDPAQTIASPAIVCPGYQNVHVVTGPDIPNAEYYYWTWRNNTATTSTPELFFDIPVTASAGIWEICVYPFSSCDTTVDVVCTQLEVQDIEDVIKETAIVCPENFPFFWHDIFITEPGVYELTVQDSNGCLRDSIWTIDAYPVSDAGSVDTIHCMSSFSYEDLTFNASGSYLLFYPGMDINGCDSIAGLNLILGVADMFIEVTCDTGQSFLMPQILSDTSQFNTFIHTWHDCSFTQTLSNELIFPVSIPGCYCLVINTGYCLDTICSNYDQNPCELTCDLVPDSVCISDVVSLTYEGDSTASVHWLIHFPGELNARYYSGDSLSIRLDSAGIYYISRTIVDDTSTFTCTDSVRAEEPATSAMICCEKLVCVDCTELEFTLTGSGPWTVTYSDGEVAYVLTNILTSPFFHTVCLNNKTVTFTLLSVTGSGDACPGFIAGDSSVTIIDMPLPVPNISSADSILCASDGAFFYEWYQCSDTAIIATTQCFVPELSGCYCVDMILSEECRVQACIDFIVSNDELHAENNISIHPNPSKGKFNIRLPENIQLPVNWELHDIHGIKTSKGILNEIDSQLNLDGITAPGIYFLKILGTERVFKLVIE